MFCYKQLPWNITIKQYIDQEIRYVKNHVLKQEITEEKLKQLQSRTKPWMNEYC